MASKTNKLGRLIQAAPREPILKEASGIWTLDEAIQNNYINRWPQPDLLQPVERSLRFSTSDSTSLAYTPSRPGNRLTWTLSFWIKRTGYSTYQIIFQAGNASNVSEAFLYWIDGTIRYYETDSAGNAVINVFPTSSYRDSSSWYHIVLAYDSTKSVANERIKFYVNGTDLAGILSATFPSQGYPSAVNSTYTHRIGTRFANIQHLDAYLSETHFIDGSQLTASDFGQTGVNGIWIPKPYLGNYGTNGFYLPYKNGTSQLSLGYDYSNTSNYTVDQDPHRGNVVLHITGNGTSGGQNNTFVDSSPNSYTITRSGSPTQGSFSPYQFDRSQPYNPATHGASGYFNGISGTGDYLSISDNAVFNLSSGSFTIEAWIYLVATGSADLHIFSKYSSYVFWVDDSTLKLGFDDNASLYLQSSANALKLNTWHHVAIVRNASTPLDTLYIDGVSVASSSSLRTITNNSNNLFISSNTTVQGYFRGYIADLRFNKSAIYTGNFRPPRRPLGTSTKNLLNFSENFTNSTWVINGGSVVDNSTIAPDRTFTAAKYIENTVNENKEIYQAVSITSGITYTFSGYFKSNGRNVRLMSYATSFLYYIDVNLSTGSVISTLGSGTHSITYISNGWYRLSVTVTSTGNGIGYWDIRILNSSSNNVYQGDGASGLYVWGAQLEQSSTVGEYIPTPENTSTAPSLLLNFANASVVDASGSTNITTYNNSKTTSVSKYGSGGLLLSSTSSDYMQVTDNKNSLTFGTDDFTVESWVLFNSISPTQCIFAGYDSNGANISGPLGWTIRNSGLLNFEANIASSTFDYIGGTGYAQTSVSTNTWYHLASVRHKGTLYAFIDGKLINRVSVGSYVMTTPGTSLVIGRAGAYNGQYFNGLVDDFRVTKGLARYTSDFTPPNRALPEIGGKSFIPQNFTTGVVKSFTTVGTTSWTCPQDVTSVEALVVAGGGGAGYGVGGGGGAGGLIYHNNYPVTPGQTYTITIGTGGQGVGSSYLQAGNGQNSIFGSLIAIGGGAGGTGSAGPYPGFSGGSGGGSSNNSATGGSATAGQGYAGGGGIGSDPSYPASGGGGAGAQGGIPVGQTAGSGGIGLQFSISGSPTYYAGGGGGGVYTGAGTPGTGGSGGGGGGGISTTAGTSGTANTGGGGGGGGNSLGGSGGSGIVILRYTTQQSNQYDATNDLVVDTPTNYGTDFGKGGEVRGNYATLNPLSLRRTPTLSNGNLSLMSTSSNDCASTGTIAIPTSGKWYWETTLGPYSGQIYLLYTGLLSKENFPGGNMIYTPGAMLYPRTGATVIYDNTGSGLVITESNVPGDVFAVAYNADTNVVDFYKNGKMYSGYSITVTANTEYWPFLNYGNQNAAAYINFGQHPWKFPPPSGYLGLSVENLPKPAIAKPSEHIGFITYTGNGLGNRSFTGLNFKPDLVVIKNRNSSSTNTNWYWCDSNRGASKTLYSNQTFVQSTDRGVSTFDNNGFTLDSATTVELTASGEKFVAIQPHQILLAAV